MTTLLLLALSFAAADTPRAETQTVRVFDLATLSHEEAKGLEGTRQRFLITLDSRPGGCGPFVVYDSVGPKDDLRLVWLRQEQPDSRATLTVEATLRLVRRQPSRDGVFEGFWEYRLTEAMRK